MGGKIDELKNNTNELNKQKDVVLQLEDLKNNVIANFHSNIIRNTNNVKPTTQNAITNEPIKNRDTSINELEVERDTLRDKSVSDESDLIRAENDIKQLDDKIKTRER